LFSDTNQQLLDHGRAFLNGLRAEHAKAVADAERLASTIASVEEVLRTLADAPAQRQTTFAPPELRPVHRIDVPVATATAQALPPSLRISPTGNGWARRLQGLTQHEAIVQIAEDLNGSVRTGQVADILLRAGLSNAEPRNLYRYVLHFFTTSGKFEKAGKGRYRLATSRTEEDSDIGSLDKVHWDEDEDHDKPWTSADDRKLDDLIRQNTPTGLIAHELGRTEDAVRSHASDTGRSLKPVNQSPYNRQQKS
jgi:hypothetical protein